jgi:hypothetical protein
MDNEGGTNHYKPTHRDEFLFLSTKPIVVSLNSHVFLGFPSSSRLS